MKAFVVTTVLLVLVAGAQGGAVRPASSPRQARWFFNRGDVTEVVEEERKVTQVTPWSCVVVAPSLPPCRHVRQLDIHATPPTPIAATAAPSLFHGDHNLVEQARRRYYLDSVVPQDSYYGDMIPVPSHAAAALTPPLHDGWVPLMAREATETLPAAPAPPAAQAPSGAPAPPAGPASPLAPPAEKRRELGWAEWLGLRAYTITSTRVLYATTRMVDPDTVVTFSVRGCQPSKLPFDLPLCVAPQSQQMQEKEPTQQGHSLSEATAPAVEVSPAAPTAPAAAAAAPAPAAPAPETPPAAAGDVEKASPPATPVAAPAQAEKASPTSASGPTTVSASAAAAPAAPAAQAAQAAQAEQAAPTPAAAS